jgi:hypothetical protein
MPWTPFVAIVCFAGFVNRAAGEGPRQPAGGGPDPAMPVGSGRAVYPDRVTAWAAPVAGDRRGLLARSPFPVPGGRRRRAAIARTGSEESSVGEAAVIGR